ncbi:MAG: hypothetical protein LC795_14140 [Acidobacteria bacterium]|nr:hypothetical protein [Acidobacteriota bacterium]MCA1620419.1 hypothetical protein [Acidobacteriota bacterium]
MSEPAAAPAASSDGSAAGSAFAGARASRALSSFIFAALVALLPLAAVPYGSVEPWWTGLFGAAVFALAALWAVEGALAGGWLTRARTPSRSPPPRSRPSRSYSLCRSPASGR